LTAFIALIVAFITALQWITARQKVVLDLFDKRYAIYEELCEVILRSLTQPPASVEDIEKFTRATRRAEFLFGLKVTKFLDETRKDFAGEVFASTHRPGPEVPEDQRKAAEDKMLARVNRLTDFFKDFDAMVSPYMKHTQKRFPIPYIDS
jgi:hypothetical protein